MLALDLGVFHRKAHVVTVKEALAWSAVWLACPGTSFLTTLGNTYFYDPALVECMMFSPYLSSFSSSLSRYERPLMART
jgi:hypothetical protein